MGKQAPFKEEMIDLQDLLEKGMEWKTKKVKYWLNGMKLKLKAQSLNKIRNKETLNICDCPSNMNSPFIS